MSSQTCLSAIDSNSCDARESGAATLRQLPDPAAALLAVPGQALDVPVTRPSDGRNARGSSLVDGTAHTNRWIWLR